MLILHGIYDSGKVINESKDLPEIRSEVEIRFKQKNIKKSRFDHFLKDKPFCLLDLLYSLVQTIVHLDYLL